MNGLPIDDAMVTLVYSGDFEQCADIVSRTALLEMLRRHGFDGKGGIRDLASALDRWAIPAGRNGRVTTADLAAAVDDGRVAPTVRVYQSEWNQMMGVTDPLAKLRMIDDMLERLAVPARYYNERITRLRAIREDVNRDVTAALNVGPTRPLLPET